jgi:hypothetical protein
LNRPSQADRAPTRPRNRLLLASFAVIVPLAAAWWSIRPSNARDWSPDQAVLPRAEIDGGMVRVHDVRDFRHDSSSFTPRYADRAYDLDRLESVWLVLTPFSKDWRGPAHAFLSFGFADSQYVAISVEARRERGETYAVWKGALKRYELTYVIGEERDLIGLRAARGDDVLLYSVRATPAQARELFVSMLRRANELREKPEFYGSFRNNCTTNILDHVNTIARPKIRFGPRILLPGYSDAVAFERGLIDTDLTLEEARIRFHVTGEATAYAGRDDFSRRIRAGH